jgi:hypothetical protein
LKIKNHLDIIKNFSDISPSMVLTSDKIKVINASESILATYEWNEKLPVDKIGIYNVREFTQIVSLFSEPEISIEKINNSEDSYKIIITDDNQKSKYSTTSPDIIRHTDKEVNIDKLGEPDVVFEIYTALLKKIKNCIGVVQAKHLVLNIDDNENLKLILTNLDNSSANNYEFSFPKDKYSGKFDGDIIMYCDDFMFVEGNYTVDAFKDRLFKFTEKDKKVSYFVSSKIN